ncbi:hypothetical protein LTR70_010257 [Exophiala xenobiotica]|uniref:Uncharacterized protein n=1 Tax=Lithohypha guttulata TaxID=1690604 RepID=A0ABR0JX28_9EURO|nr:hypothetical protein LTR24_009664 [Lithohypha guttulata]KAK5309463.1 hypothetical protein LTR70_010257 [Exophiala xenobiotica]
MLKGQVVEPVVTENLQGIAIAHGVGNDNSSEMSLAKWAKGAFPASTDSLDWYDPPAHEPEWQPFILGSTKTDGSLKQIFQQLKPPRKSHKLDVKRWKATCKRLSYDGKVRFTNRLVQTDLSGQQYSVSAWGIVSDATSMRGLHIIVCTDADVDSEKMTDILTKVKKIVFSPSLVGSVEGQNDRVVMLSKRTGLRLSDSEVFRSTLQACEDLRELLLLGEPSSTAIFEVVVVNAENDSIAEGVARSVGQSPGIRVNAAGVGQADGCNRLGVSAWDHLKNLPARLKTAFNETTSIELSSLPEDGYGAFLPPVRIADSKRFAEESTESEALFAGGGLSLRINLQPDPSTFGSRSAYTFRSTAWNQALGNTAYTTQ